MTHNITIPNDIYQGILLGTALGTGLVVLIMYILLIRQYRLWRK